VSRCLYQQQKFWIKLFLMPIHHRRVFHHHIGNRFNHPKQVYNFRFITEFLRVKLLLNVNSMSHLSADDVCGEWNLEDR
jgi:hypothetical protein